MILAIVQARSSSSRLPGKVLKKIVDVPMILLELQRVKRASLIDKIILATSDDASDDELSHVVGSAGYCVYRGSLSDVLDRYYQCANLYGATAGDHVVRITGDCPLIDPQIIDLVIRKHLEEENDYSSNILGEETFPDGLDTEIMTYNALEYAWKDAILTSEREHVTLYIRNHSELFKQGGIKYWGESLGGERWTVDEPLDFEFVRHVYENLYLNKPNFSMIDILNFLENHPEYRKINQGYTRNDGLKKSLRNDKVFGR